MNIKDKAVKYMGGCCLICGYNKCNRALHFHHINNFEKDFDISSKTSWSVVKEELDKCVLLCANCHMEAHDNLIDPELLIELGEI